MSHTPGPWRANETHDELLVETGDLDICQVYEPEDCDPEMMARAKADLYLIAAAPELHSAVRMLLASHDASCPGSSCPINGIDFARMALAKAEGRL